MLEDKGRAVLFACRGFLGLNMNNNPPLQEQNSRGLVKSFFAAHFQVTLHF